MKQINAIYHVHVRAFEYKVVCDIEILHPRRGNNIQRLEVQLTTLRGQIKHLREEFLFGRIDGITYPEYVRVHCNGWFIKSSV